VLADKVEDDSDDKELDNDIDDRDAEETLDSELGELELSVDSIIWLEDDDEFDDIESVFDDSLDADESDDKKDSVFDDKLDSEGEDTDDKEESDDIDEDDELDDKDEILESDDGDDGDELEDDSEEIDESEDLLDDELFADSSMSANMFTVSPALRIKGPSTIMCLSVTDSPETNVVTSPLTVIEAEYCRNDPCLLKSIPKDCIMTGLSREKMTLSGFDDPTSKFCSG